MFPTNCEPTTSRELLSSTYQSNFYETYGGNAVGPNSYRKSSESLHIRDTLLETRKNQSKLAFVAAYL